MPISCRVARNGHKRQTPHPPLSRSPFPSRGRLTESATLNLKQTARRSSYLTFGRYACGNNIPTTRLRSAELEARGTKGCPLGTLLSPISCRVARNGHLKHILTIFPCSKEQAYQDYKLKSNNTVFSSSVSRQAAASFSAGEA